MLPVEVVRVRSVLGGGCCIASSTNCPPSCGALVPVVPGTCVDTVFAGSVSPAANFSMRTLPTVRGSPVKSGVDDGAGMAGAEDATLGLGFGFGFEEEPEQLAALSGKAMLLSVAGCGFVQAATMGVAGEGMGLAGLFFVV